MAAILKSISVTQKNDRALLTATASLDQIKALASSKDSTATGAQASK